MQCSLTAELVVVEVEAGEAGEGAQLGGILPEGGKHKRTISGGSCHSFKGPPPPPSLFDVCPLRRDRLELGVYTSLTHLYLDNNQLTGKGALCCLPHSAPLKTVS